MSMDFELKLDGKTMSRFLLHYNYTKATGLFGILLGIASLAAVFIKWNMWNANQRVVWIVIAVLFLIVQPLTLAKKGRRQMAQEEMQIPLFCHIDEEGISVTQGEASSSCKWSIPNPHRRHRRRPPTLLPTWIGKGNLCIPFESL